MYIQVIIKVYLVYTSLGGGYKMLKRLFAKKEVVQEEIVMAPVSGTIRQLEEVPDPVFSQKMMGEGIAIEPSDGIVVAPFDGEIVQLFPTKHAIGLKGKSGLEILIHIGLETVTLDGEGFEAFIKQGDHVKLGEKLVEFEMDVIKEKASSMITPIIMTNGDAIEKFDMTKDTTVVAGESKLIDIHMK
jgi:glucose-specific phosphotransferase system IIA component